MRVAQAPRLHSLTEQARRLRYQCLPLAPDIDTYRYALVEMPIGGAVADVDV